ncbi:ANTAR domain-containing protein [Actinophytocola sp. NPDC049390]|uniref:ANTAR domain-containing protein n=1 Tax=Actinophytocola sp. NPDC049390 TaxID=3363894 RepID=UPI0037B76099
MAELVGDDLVRKVDEVTKALEELARVLAEDDLPTVLRRICRQAVDAVPEADVASVSILRNGVAETVATTDEVAAEMDRVQYAAGEGPCLEAAATGHVVHVRVADVGARWPDFADAAAEAAVASYLSAPLIAEREYRGSLNLYGFAAHGFGRLDAALLELYTTAAGAALRSAERYLRARDHVEQLRHALVSRAVIDQAKGVIMAVRGISADEAFAVLVDQSQRENVKVRELARRFITDLAGVGG